MEPVSSVVRRFGDRYVAMDGPFEVVEGSYLSVFP